MEESEITRRNEAIARYMGWTLVDGWWKNHESFLFLSWQLEFHSNWSWLMPCVEEIVAQAGLSYNILRDDFGDGVFYKCDFNPEHYGSYIHGMRGFGKTMIEAVWMAVSDYCLSLETPAPDGKEA
jgi:hypothetical protein